MWGVGLSPIFRAVSAEIRKGSKNCEGSKKQESALQISFFDLWYWDTS